MNPPRNNELPGTELLIVDQAPIRDAAIEALDEVRAEFEELKNQWATYTLRDQPFFQSWIHQSFAATLKALQECMQQIQQKRLLIDSVLQEAALKGINCREAYENVLTGEAGFQGENPSEIRDDSSVRDLFEAELRECGIDPDEMDREQYEARLAGFKSDNGFGDEESWTGGVFSEAEREEEARQQHRRESARERAREEERVGERAKLSGEIETQTKRLYRLLARRLHPDTGSEQSPESQSLWLEVQQAYEERDLRKLESLWSVLNENDESENSSKTISIWEIRQMFKQVLTALSSLKKDIRKAHKDPAWGFSLPGSRKGKKVHKKIRRELEEELAEAQDALASLEALIDSWMLGDQQGSRGHRWTEDFEEG